MSARARQWLIGGLVAAIALGAGLWLGRGRVDDAELRARAVLANAAWNDTTGKPLAIAALRGKVVVLNFWATWCAPCREEIPAFMRAQRVLGDRVQIVGLAIDSPQQVAAFAQELAVTFPLVVLGAEGIALMRTLGNAGGGLPFTVVLDAEGRIHGRHLGALDQASIERLARGAAASS